MDGFDLDNPLRFDDCEACGAIDWKDCVCSPSSTRKPPSDIELERSRAERLTRAERERGAA